MAIELLIVAYMLIGYREGVRSLQFFVCLSASGAQGCKLRCTDCSKELDDTCCQTSNNEQGDVEARPALVPSAIIKLGSSHDVFLVRTVSS